MPYDDDNPHSVFLGNGDSPGDELFDPFEPRVGTSLEPDDREDGNVDGDIDTATFQYDPNNRGRQFGNSHQGSPDNDGPIPWPRSPSQSTIGEQSERDRAAADTGDRNIRRVADSRTGGSQQRIVRRERAEGVASSILDAQQRVRTHLSIPLSDEERADIPRVAEPGGDKTIRHFIRSGIHAPPQFEQTVFEATIHGLKSNASGDWIIQFIVPAADRDAATILGDAYGLALDVAVIRKHFGPGGQPPGTTPR
jgi:hypothetical protein